MPRCFAVEQAGVDEPLQVVRDRRLREAERLGQLADANGLAGVDEQVDEPHARRLARARRRGAAVAAASSSESTGAVSGAQQAIVRQIDIHRFDGTSQRHAAQGAMPPPDMSGV